MQELHEENHSFLIDNTFQTFYAKKGFLSMHKLLLKSALFCIPLFVGFILGVIIYHQILSQAKPQPATVVATYAGKLPCADCSGITSTIKLMSDHTYQESDVYIGKNTTFNANGYWMVVQGIPGNPTASSYQLAPYGQSTNTFYEIVSENKITQLDQNRNPISSPFNQTLTKK